MSNLGEEYDYIICGGGISGCVLAARLAEDANISVLLLEAGRDSKDVETIQMTMGYEYDIAVTKAEASGLIVDDSNIQHTGTKDDWNIWSEPSPGINNRKIQCIRGRMLGGSSTINGTICVRGTKADYDAWNVPGWSGDEVFRCMRKSETFHPKPWFEHSQDDHGSDGPLHTTAHELAPISKLMMKSFEHAGLAYKGDMFSAGTVAQGCGHTVRTVHDGLRTTAADFVADRSKWTNLDIMCDATVDKVVFGDQAGGKPKATGVVVTQDGAKGREFRAKKEVIVSGGAYCSPAILLRSGIGPAAELKSLGISVLVDLQGVGKNLQDHVLTGTAYEVTDPSLTLDSFIYPEGAMARSLETWQSSHTGVLSTFPFGTFAYARLDDRLSDVETWNAATDVSLDSMGLSLKQPNIEIWNTECYGGPPHWTDFPVNGNAVFSAITQLWSPRSRGTVKLKSKDPMENPIVDHRYLDDPLDLIVMAEGTRFANEIVTRTPPIAGVIKGAWPENLTHNKMTAREDWMEYVKENAFTGYHPAGTCKMGTAEDSLAVVDQELRVHGVDNLRIVDVSIMPTLNQGHTQMPAYGIAEKAAEIIRSRRG